MPWHVERSSSCPASKPYAVIRDRDGHKEGCHTTRDSAEAQMRALYAAESGKDDQSMLNKRYEVELKAAGDDDPEGTIVAYASVFGTVDLVGDRVIPGAFTKSLRKWRESGDPIPIILDHQWGDVNAHIGVANPQDVKQTQHGLLGKGVLDIHDNPVAAQTYKLLKRRSLKSFSFGYTVKDEELDEEGVNDLLELDLIEFGPTLKGAHPDAELVGVKSAVEASMVKNTDLRRRTEEAALELAMGGRKRNVHADRKADDPGFIDQVVDGIMVRFADLGILSEDQAKAVWSTAYINDLPDSAFLYIAPGGSKEDGKTTPRSLRYFPVRDANGKVDLAHVRNALARIPQSDVPKEAKDKATAAAERLLRENGGKDAPVEDGEPDPPNDPAKATGKRDDPLRRATEEIALDLANGREPRVAKPPKDPRPAVGVDPGPAGKASDPEGVKAPNVVINFDGDFATAISDTIVARIDDRTRSEKPIAPDAGKKDEDPEKKDEEPEVKSDEDERPTEKDLRAATRAAVLEMAMGDVKSDPSLVEDKSEKPDEKKSDPPPPPPAAPDPTEFASAVVSKLDELFPDDSGKKGGRDALRKRTDRQRLEMALGRRVDDVPEGVEEAVKAQEEWDAKKEEHKTPEEIADAVVSRLDQRKKDEEKADEEDPTERARKLREATDRERLEQAMGEKVKRGATTQDTPTPEEFAEAVAEKLEQKRTSKESKKSNDEKADESKSNGRDPLRKRTEQEALDQALGRSAQDVPDIAHPEPPKEPDPVPDEKTLRRQTNQTALDLALGGFK